MLVSAPAMADKGKKQAAINHHDQSVGGDTNGGRGPCWIRTANCGSVFYKPSRAASRLPCAAERLAR